MSVVAKVTISDIESAEEGLRRQVVPAVSQAPRFVAGYWTRSDDGKDGLSMVVFESEDASRQRQNSFSGVIKPESVTLDGVEIRQVVEHA
jgi:hypothetical protein